VTRSRSLWRGVLLILILGGGLVAFAWWWGMTSTQFCPPGFHLPGSPEPGPLTALTAYATIPPVVLFFLGAWISLGAREVRWRWVGLGFSALALVIGLWIGQTGGEYSPCM
jgi:hypothetical protein